MKINSCSCGNELPSVGYIFDDKGEVSRYRVECRTCEKKTPCFDREEYAILEWNILVLKSQNEPILFV